MKRDEVQCWKADVDVNGHKTMFKLDTGADGMVFSHLKPWFRDIILSGPVRVPGARPKEHRGIGTFRVGLSYKGRTHRKIVHVVKDHLTSLLSRQACQGLRLVSCHIEENSINTMKDKIVSGF